MFATVYNNGEVICKEVLVWVYVLFPKRSHFSSWGNWNRISTLNEVCMFRDSDEIICM